MFDRDIEDTRQPKESPLMSECDGCGDLYDTDSLTYTDGLWLCDDCLEDNNA